MEPACNTLGDVISEFFHLGGLSPPAPSRTVWEGTESEHFFAGNIFILAHCFAIHILMTVILNIPFPLFKEGIMGQSHPRFSANVILHSNIMSQGACFHVC